MESIAGGGEGGGIVCHLCILCQTSLPEKVSVLGSNGWERIKTCTEQRKDLLDTENVHIIDRLSSFDSYTSDKYVYHKSCYERYTNKAKIERLQKNLKLKKVESGRTLRSTVDAIFNKQLCIICQIDKDSKNLRNASTYAVSNRLDKVACFDYTLKRRMAYAFDAMAGDIRYHTYCLLHKEREFERVSKDESDTNVSFRQLRFELHSVAAKGQVVTLEAVFQRYTVLAKEVNEEVPHSYVSRRSTFREKLETHFSNLFQFYRPLQRDVNERGTLLISHSFHQKVTSEKVFEEEELTIPTFQPSGDVQFIELIHVALKLRSDLKSAAMQQHQQGINISKEDAASVVPESVFMFLSLVFGGKDPIENVESTMEESHESTFTHSISNKILSLAQDFVYIASKNRKLTPKHIGLALTLHQKTRSRELVGLFNSAGHCASYEQVLQLETAMGRISLGSMDPITGCVVPVNLRTADDLQTSVLHVTADNVDIQMDSLDGKQSFHGTQMVVFQRDINTMDNSLRTAVRSKERSLKIPKAIGNIIQTNIVTGKTEPVFKGPVDVTWYKFEEPPIGVQEANTLDAVFLLHREHAPTRVGWTEFNKNATNNNPSVSGAGYMPLILQPAHETSTLYTVLERSLFLADHLKHPFITLTVDQQLYCKLQELIWATEKFRFRIILRMGGLHISLNFLKAIGQHMSCSGLTHAWVESGILTESSAAKVEDGKAYGKGMRIHKLTLQALWRIMEPPFFQFMAEKHPVASEELQAARGDIDQLLPLTRKYNVFDLFSRFVCEQKNVNMQYWWSYMRMVLTLLQFTRSIRDGVWDLYKVSLTEMLPWMARYDHNNYFKSMAVYIADLNQLPTIVEAAFQRGEFVVKRSPGKFNQVDPDHAQEWTVSDAKAKSGIVGLIQQEDALQRWALTFSWRGDICNKTKELLDINHSSHSQSQLNPARQRRDQEDEDKLKNTLTEFDVCDLQHPTELRSIATKDVATKPVLDSLLNAKEEGEKQVIKFVEDRLGPRKLVSFYATVTLNRPPTFASLYKSVAENVSLANRKKIKEDRSILQRVIVAFEAGRAVDLPEILKHELFDVPLSLALPDGSLRSGTKSDILKLLTKDISIPAAVHIEKKDSHLIIDGQALIQARGATSKAKTFKDFSCEFLGFLKSMGEHYSRVDVVFDRYDRVSTKSGTRSKRVCKTRPIRKNIDSGNVPFPQNWSNYMALPENKAELALFLSREVITHPISHLEVVVAGGFQDGKEVSSTCPATILADLQATHEEADTRIILHAVHSPYKNVVVSARDTDVFLLLAHHFKSMKCKECWIMMGTKKNRQFAPIHEVQNVLPSAHIHNLLAFLAVTGCDTILYLTSLV